MKYTIYKVTDLDTNKMFVSAYRGDKLIKRVQNKKIISNIGKNIHTEIVEILPSLNDTKIKLSELCNDKSLTVIKIDRKIPVKDKNGNEFRIYKDDERYLSGELVNINKGKVACKDSHGNYFSLNKEEFIKSRFVGVMKNKVVVKDNIGNIFSVNKNDERYLNKQLSFISIGRKFKKKKQKRGFTHNTNSARYINLAKKYKKKYNIINEVISYKKNLIIKDYCLHGVLIIEKNIFNKIYHISEEKIYCEKCKIEILKNKNFTNEEFIYYKNLFNNLSKNKSEIIYKKKYVYLYYPFIYKIISDISLKYNINWIESCYIFKNDINKIPICEHENCENTVRFANASKHYNKFCDLHSNCYSSQQKELKTFITNNYDNIILENKNKIIKGQLDIYIPDKKLAIEFNGIYWHGDLFKEKDYHYNKWKMCKDKGIKLITIWEDDWNNKGEIVKNIINNELELISTKINTRDCSIKEINYKETKEFLNNNHLQGFCPSSINIGLILDNELISIITFRKIRNINYNLNVNDFELLRFCNKLNISIKGAASKLFKYFIDNFKPNKIISYANCDISDSNFYNILGFKEIRHIGINYWWGKNNNKFNKSNLMKHKLIEQGYDHDKTEDEIMRERGFFKIYGTGNLKYEKNF